eukprot:m.57345 g.57345  ORF g.57345 m.57345 type:complete len:342 (-) comp22371_c2_seq1:13-1038(-)
MYTTHSRTSVNLEQQYSLIIMSDDDYSEDFDDGDADENNSDYGSPADTPSASSHYKGTNARKTLSSRSSVPAQRVESAASKNYKKIKNKLMEKEQQLGKAQKEIKLLVELQRRQEKALDRYTADEADLPRTLRSKDEEIRTLQTRIRKYKEKLVDKERAGKKSQKQIQKLSDQQAQLEKLVNSKDLKGRAELETEVESLSEQLKDKDRHIAKLERKIELFNKDRGRKAPTASSAKVAQLEMQIADLRRMLGERLDRQPKATTPAPKSNTHATSHSTTLLTKSTALPQIGSHSPNANTHKASNKTPSKLPQRTTQQGPPKQQHQQTTKQRLLLQQQQHQQQQ